MGWNRVKKMFKKKKGIKIENHLNSDFDIMLKSRDLGDGKFEVNGVVFFCDTHAEAIRKYRRGLK